MKKIDLVYITSLSHSGSTLLDLILGSHKNIESIGEIINLKNSLKENKFCTCGKVISNCEYWDKILKNYYKDISVIDNNFLDIIDLKSFIVKNIFSKLLLFLSKDRWFNKNFITNYGLKNYYLFKNILKYTNKNIILDSSKNIVRLYLLEKSGFFNVKVIYLFRDGRAQLESVKRKANDPNRQYANYKGPLKTTLDVIKGSIHIRRTLNKNFNSENIFGLRYYDLTNEPSKIITKIFKFLNIDSDISLEKILDLINYNNHNIGGNRLRFRPINEIKNIEKWRDNLSVKEKLIFSILGGNLINKNMNKFLYKYNIKG